MTTPNPKTLAMRRQCVRRTAQGQRQLALWLPQEAITALDALRQAAGLPNRSAALCYALGVAPCR